MSWPMVALGEICTFVNGDRGKNYPSGSDFVSAGIPFINAGDLNENSIAKSGFNFITREKFNLLNSGKIRRDDLLFCLRGSLGKMAIVDNLTEGAIASSLVIIRSGEKIQTRYLFEYLRSRLCENEIKQYANGAVKRR
ncbi:MAG: restriction endonuclease subunit S [Methylobacter sp.]